MVVGKTVNLRGSLTHAGGYKSRLGGFGVQCVRSHDVSDMNVGLTILHGLCFGIFILFFQQNSKFIYFIEFRISTVSFIDIPGLNMSISGA